MVLTALLWCAGVAAALTWWWYREIRPHGFVPALGQPNDRRFTWRRALLTGIPVALLLTGTAALVPWKAPYDVLAVALPWLVMGIGLEVVRRRHNRAHPAPAPATTPFTAAAAGPGAAWYPDPWAASTWRWFDGDTWTGWTA